MIFAEYPFILDHQGINGYLNVPVGFVPELRSGKYPFILELICFENSVSISKTLFLGFPFQCSKKNSREELHKNEVSPHQSHSSQHKTAEISIPVQQIQQDVTEQESNKQHVTKRSVSSVNMLPARTGARSNRDGAAGRANARSRPNFSSPPNNRRGTTVTPPVPPTDAAQLAAEQQQQHSMLRAQQDDEHATVQRAAALQQQQQPAEYQANLQQAAALLQGQEAALQAATLQYPPELRNADEAIVSSYFDPVLRDFPSNPRVFGDFLLDVSTLQGCLDRSDQEKTARLNGEWRNGRGGGRPLYSIPGDPARLAIHPIYGGSSLVQLDILRTAISTPMDPGEVAVMRRLIDEYEGRTEIRETFETLRSRNQ